MTFSIAARCAASGMLGVAVSSSSPAVAARCAHVRARAGAVCSQNITDPRLGPKALTLMQEGASAPRALASILAAEPNLEFRQLVLVDAKGASAVHSGAGTLGTHGSFQGQGCAAAGNLLKHTAIPEAMVKAFEGRDGHLADRLLGAMRAALDDGGEMGPVHSAGMLIAHEVSWPIVDLRVDWSDGDPILELAHLWSIYRSQVDAYVTRALDPGAAPSFGVPGDR